METLKLYNHAKNRYPDAIIFIEAGDYYVTFKEDAQETARITGSKLKITDSPIPTVTTRFATGNTDMILTRLINNGYKVALCNPVNLKP